MTCFRHYDILAKTRGRMQTATTFSRQSGEFKIQLRGRQRERQKIGFISKITTLQVHHTCLYISFPVLHDYDVKMPIFAFYGERKQATTKIV